MNKGAPDCLVDIWVTGNKAHIDRNFNPIIEGQRSHVILRFHFIEGWEDRPCRMVTLINAAKVYTTEMHEDMLQVPIHMLQEGDLRFIVRGFAVTTDLNVVIRNGHFIITDEPQAADMDAKINVPALGRFILSDEKKYREGFTRNNAIKHSILTDETLYKETHDIPPVSEDETGYVEVNNMEDPICITGGINGYMLRR